MTRLRPALLLVVGAALLVSACGSATPAPTAAAAPTAGQAAPAAAAGVGGTIAAVAASSLEVQDPRTGQVTVDFSATTTFSRTVAASAAALTVGSCATVTPAAGDGTAGQVTAASVTISPATAQGCRAGGGFGAGGRAGQGTRPSGTNLAPGAGGRGRGASGAVTAVSATGFTVQPANASATPVTVTTSPTTTYLTSGAADKSALVVGQCAVAVGPADDTGAVAARTISVRAPGADGCTAAFGGRGGRTASAAGNG